MNFCEVGSVCQGGVHRYTAFLVGEPSATVRPSGARVGWLSLTLRVTVVTPLTAPELVMFHVNTVSRVAMLYVGVTLPSWRATTTVRVRPSGANATA